MAARWIIWRVVGELAEHAGKYALHNYQGFCLCMQAIYKIRRGGEISAASAMLYSGVEKLSAAPSRIFRGKGLTSSNARKTILTKADGMVRNSIASGANWP